MTPGEINVFLWGASAVASWTAGLFFLRFWRDTRDRFFAFFALAFWALAVNYLGLALTRTTHEARTYFYLVRLLSFVLIIWAVVEKNRSAFDEAESEASRTRRGEEGTPGGR